MSTLKKVISLVLCVAMLVGTFALVGNVAPVAEAAEGTSKVQSYADLVAQYGQNGDGFVYTGLEFFEADGKLTDYYVNAGDQLTARVYIKSNMYVGESYILTLYDNKFFDIKLAGGPGSTTVATGYTSNYQDAPINANHPIVIANSSGHTLTTINLNGVGWIKNLCGFSQTYLNETDLAQSNTATDTTVSIEAYDMKSDIWLFEYYVKVKEGLADGTTGVVASPLTLWHASINTATKKHDARKKAYIAVINPADYPTKHQLTQTTTMAAAMDAGIIDHFVQDHDHEFIIGENTEAEATKYKATFYAEDQSTVISAVDTYLDLASVEFPASVENQIGWAIVSEGMATPGTLLTPDADGNYAYSIKAADVAFLRVLSTSKFPVTVSLNSKADEITVDAAALEAAGVEYLADKAALNVMLSLGESFDLASIEDAIDKKGNEISGWEVTATEPSTAEGSVFTLNTINGVLGTSVTLSAKANWKAEVYTINFYADKESVGTADPVYTKELEYNSKVNYGAITNVYANKKFTGWYNAADDSFISDKNGYTFTVTEDIDVYAVWSDYKNVATFMVRDYANETWTAYTTIVDKNEGETATVTKERVEIILKAVCADANTSLRGVYTTNPDEITDGTHGDYAVPGILQLTADAFMTAPIEYSGAQTYYIATTSACEVTWMAPAYDEETNTFDEENATVINKDSVRTVAFASEGNPYAAVSKPGAFTIPTGYEVAAWKDAATGEIVALNESGAFELNAAAKSATLVAVFDLVQYPVAFNLRNSDTPDVVMLEGTVTLGDSLDISGAKFTFNGNESVLPEIGLANDKQADGGYKLPEGYKFAGWTLGYGSTATEAKFPVEINADLLRKNFASGAIQLNATWEAQDYTLSFYITNAKGEEELFATHTVKVGADIASYRNVTAEMAAAINAKAEEGKVFSNIWYNKETNAADTSMTRMPAKDVSYYAVYTTATVKVYVDYNHLADKDLNQSMDLFKVEGKEILGYGDDTAEVKEAAPYYNRSFQTVVMRSLITKKPADASEVIGWNIYHVGAGEDPYTAEWKPGVNDDGTTIANSTLIFQPIWLAHKDMLFRVYDTDGNIAHALGKNFQTYFWNNGEIVESSKDTAINRSPDLYFAYILTMSIEGFDWNEFFNIEMWQGISLRFDPFAIPKSWLTWEGFKGIFEAIGNALGSLL